eukprot:259678_1
MHSQCTMQLLTILAWVYLVHPADLDALTKQNISCSNNECVVYCSWRNCQNKLIDARAYGSLHLLCDTDENAPFTSCSHSTILCPQNGICRVECTTDHICSDLHIISDGNASKVYLQCNAYSCSDMTLNASSVDTVHVVAIGSHALTQSSIYAENANTFSLDCGQQNVHSKDACLHNDLYLPSHSNSSVILNCFGESCRGSSLHVMESVEDIEMNIVSNCECNE